MMETEEAWEIVNADDPEEKMWSPRRKHCAIAQNGKILVLGGFVGGKSTGTNDVWSYDVSENCWK